MKLTAKGNTTRWGTLYFILGMRWRTQPYGFLVYLKKTCPETMTNFLTAKWQNLIMANYVVDPEILIPYLPKGVELDLYQGQTFVSLVGFLFKDTKIFNIPIPLLGTFEEINLRFYVTREINGGVNRGVVFINETVPNKIVAWVANYLYKEHYISIPTKHRWSMRDGYKDIDYQWKMHEKWSHIQVVASSESKPMSVGSAEEFIFEHYYGYTRINETSTEEYRIDHARWNVYGIESYQIDCDFSVMYGPDFQFLNGASPHSVMLAEGSSVAVKWERSRF